MERPDERRPPSLAEVDAHLTAFVDQAPATALFVGPKGALLERSNFRRVWRGALRDAGAPAYRFHDLRHLAATLAAVSGATARELMARMDHSSPRAAMIYQHATADRDRGCRTDARLRRPGRPSARGAGRRRRRSRPARPGRRRVAPDCRCARCLTAGRASALAAAAGLEMPVGLTGVRRCRSDWQARGRRLRSATPNVRGPPVVDLVATRGKRASRRAVGGVPVKVEFVTSVAVVTPDPPASRRLYVDALGLPLEGLDGDYFATGHLGGCNHFGVWPLSQAAEACFGVSAWPGNVLRPQMSVVGLSFAPSLHEGGGGAT